MSEDLDRRPRGFSRRDFLRSGVVVGAGAATVAASAPALAEGRGRSAALVVGGLRAGGMRNPLGIGTPAPRLSWLLRGTGTDRSQRAYQVQAATSGARLRSGRPDLWDSGRVVSSSTTQVAYAGKTLDSRAQVFWQVRVWDEQGRRSAWSPTATFELGLLQPTDWTADWIGNPDWDGTVAPAKVAVAAQHARFVRLVVTKLGLPLLEAWPDPVSRLQLAEIEVLDSARPGVDLAAGAAVTATNAYPVPGTWEPEYLTDGRTAGNVAPIGFTSLEHHGQDISAEPILVTLDLGSAQDFDSLALYPRTDVRTPDGRTPNFPVDFTVQVGDTADGPFTVVTTVTDQVAPTPPAVPTALPLFASQFTLRHPARRARLYIAGLGIYSATINGRQTSNAVLEPGYTTYDTRVDYATVDVTDLLRRGANTIGVAVGTGIYDTLTFSGRYAKFNQRAGLPKLIAQLEVTYPDGSTEVVRSDSSWRTAAGPTTFSNWFGGEDYDARRVVAGWDEPGADLSGWSTVSMSEAPTSATVLSARRGPAVEAVQRLRPTKITQPKPGVYVFDLGTNVAGWQHLTVRGPAGTQVTMRPAELLAADGTIDYGTTGNPIYDVYTLSGSGLETWHPEFIYHGLRYLQVEGLPSAPTKDTVTATVLRAANDSAGTFTCSDELINGIHRIIDRAMQSNMYSVLTDCPTREKLGWMEEDHLVFDSVTRNYDITAYGHDLVQAMADAQLGNGLVPDIAPEFTVFGGAFRDDPNWGSAMVLVPWSLYRAYGDLDLLDSYYPNMQRYVDYLTGLASGNLLDYGLGDWATINATTPAGVTATYGYGKAVQALAGAASALGLSADAARYTALASQIRTAFHARYYDAAAGTYATGSQASDALALDLGAVPADLHQGVLDHLIANITGNGYHLNLGEIGLPALFDVLSSAGRSDLIHLIATQTSEPSYGAMLARGATSLTEYWDGSGSQNHFMLGAIDKWFGAGLAGIAQAEDSTGFAQLVIAPAIVGDLTHVRGTYRTPLGTVSSEWRRSGRSVTLDVCVPVGASATVRLPGSPDRVVGSGDYRFRTTLPS